VGQPLENEIKIGHARIDDSCDPNLEYKGTFTVGPYDEKVIGEFDGDLHSHIYYKSPTNLYWTGKTVSRFAKEVVIDMDTHEGPNRDDICRRWFIGQNRANQVRILEAGWIDIGDGLQIYFDYAYVALYYLGEMLDGRNIGRNSYFTRHSFAWHKNQDGSYLIALECGRNDDLMGAYAVINGKSWFSGLRMMRGDIRGMIMSFPGDNVVQYRSDSGRTTAYLKFNGPDDWKWTGAVEFMENDPQSLIDGIIKNYSSFRSLWVAEIVGNGFGIAHILSPGYQSPGDVEIECVRSTDGISIEDYNGWWRLHAKNQIDIRDSDGGLSMNCQKCSKANEYESKVIKFDFSLGWGTPIK